MQGWCLGSCKGWWHLQSQLGCTNPGFHQDVIIPHKGKSVWILQQAAALKKLPSSPVCAHPLQILLENWRNLDQLARDEVDGDLRFKWT